MSTNCNNKGSGNNITRYSKKYHNSKKINLENITASIQGPCVNPDYELVIYSNKPMFRVSNASYAIASGK